MPRSPIGFGKIARRPSAGPTQPQIGIAIHPSLSPPILHCDISAFDPAKLAELLDENGYLKATNRSFNRAKEPNGWQPRRLLCPSNNRPRCRATEPRDEIAPFTRSPRRRLRAVQVAR